MTCEHCEALTARLAELEEKHEALEERLDELIEGVHKDIDRTESRLESQISGVEDDVYRLQRDAR